MSKTSYVNGNRLVVVYDDGRKERYASIDATHSTYKPTRPENIDVNLSYKCNVGCEFCYLGAKPKGTKWTYDSTTLDQLFNNIDLRGLEVAMNLNSDNDDMSLYINVATYLNQQGAHPNFTINAKTFIERKSELQDIDYSWLGISCHDINEFNLVELELNRSSFNKNKVVIHVINGIINIDELIAVKSNIKILILGYKSIGRGLKYKSLNNLNRYISSSDIDNLSKHSNVIGFDSLALNQIDLSHREDYDEFFLGPDGTASFYIDLVKMKYSTSSTTKNKSMNIDSMNINEMFMIINNST